MKILKSIFLFTFLAMITFSSCTKENEGEGTTIVEPEIEVTESTSNVLVGEVTGRSDGEGLDLGCFIIETPFQLNVNGEIITIETEEDLENIFEDFEESDSIYIDFVYPFEITYSDGETAIINNGEELGEAFASCVPDGGWGEDQFPAYLICDINSCYQLVYPISFTDLDGNNFTVTSEDEFIELISENPNLFFTFPLTLIDEDGVEVSAENSDDLFTLLGDCESNTFPDDTLLYDFDFSLGSVACYDLAFPITVQIINSDGSVSEQSVQDEDEFTSLFLEGNLIGFGYPLTLINEDGIETTVNNDEEYSEAIYACGNVFGEDIAIYLTFLTLPENPEGACYEITYPLTFNNGVEVNDMEAAFEQITTLAELTFPIEVTQNGIAVVLESLEDMIELIEGC